MDETDIITGEIPVSQYRLTFTFRNIFNKNIHGGSTKFPKRFYFMTKEAIQLNCGSHMTVYVSTYTSYYFNA